MAKPTELADLTAELKERFPESRFRFEWSSKAQGLHLLLCGDWNRAGRRSSRTLLASTGAAILKPKRFLSTTDRQEALMAASKLYTAWLEGADTRQRCKPLYQLASSKLQLQRRYVIDQIRAREGGYQVKQKHLRHAHSLFDWLDQHNQPLDAPGAIQWASQGVGRNTDTYADRLRVAEWSCKWNQLSWTVPPARRPQSPKVERPFVDNTSDDKLQQAFSLVQDSTAETFFRVVAATGCRPAEVALFDWERWEQEGRPNYLHGYSPKVEKEFSALCYPLKWIKDIDISLLVVPGVSPKERPVSALSRELLVRHYSRLLKLVKNDLRRAGWKLVPTWTDIRHLWTLRVEIDGRVDLRTAAIAQAHSPRMAQLVYLRHGEKRQVLAAAERLASIETAAARPCQKSA